jgi:hypothetical protein
VLIELRRALTAVEPIESLAGLTALRGELEAFEREQVGRALDGGATFTAIGGTLGISRQAAHRRYRALLSGAQRPASMSTNPAPRSAARSNGSTASRSGTSCV